MHNSVLDRTTEFIYLDIAVTRALCTFAILGGKVVGLDDANLTNDDLHDSQSGSWYHFSPNAQWPETFTEGKGGGGG